MNHKNLAHIKTTYLELSETWFYSFLTSYKEYSATVFCEKTKNLEKFPFENIVKVNRVSMPTRMLGVFSRTFSFRNLSMEKMYEKSLRSGSPDLLHAHWGPTGLYMLPVAKRLGLPLVTSFYGFDTTYRGAASTKPRRLPVFQDLYWKEAYSKLFKEGDFFVAFGEKMRETLIGMGCPPEKVQDIHSGIDLSSREFEVRDLEKGEEIRILMVNRLVEKKGVEYAIKALATLHDEFDFKLQMVGDGPLGEELQDLAKRLGINDRIEWLGMVDYNRLLELFKDTHIFLTPSVKAKSGDEEGGINTTVIDALAFGVPTIATKESGSQLIFHEETGFLVEQRDEFDLAEKLKTLIGNRGLWRKFGKNGRKLIERDFDQEKQTRKMEYLYDRLLPQP